MKEENKIKLEFVGDPHDKTNGDYINAIVEHYTGEFLGEFILGQALQKVKENNKKIEEIRTPTLNTVEYFVFKDSEESFAFFKIKETTEEKGFKFLIFTVLAP